MYFNLKLAFDECLLVVLRISLRYWGKGRAIEMKVEEKKMTLHALELEACF